MPNLNGTGPQGVGPKTGRGMGNCAPGAAQRPGLGRGLGRGFGWRRFPGRNYAQPNQQPEKEMLEDELKALRQEKKEIESRLKELQEKK